MCSGSEAGSYLRLIGSCITQLKAQGPSRTCNESKKEEEGETWDVTGHFPAPASFCTMNTDVLIHREMHEVRRLSLVHRGTHQIARLSVSSQPHDAHRRPATPGNARDYYRSDAGAGSYERG